MTNIFRIPGKIDDYTDPEIKTRFENQLALEAINDEDKRNEGRGTIDGSQPSYKVDKCGFEAFWHISYQVLI